MGGYELMKKLSPSDPTRDRVGFIYKVIVDIALKPNTIVSKVASMLKEDKITVSVSPYLNIIRVTVSGNNINDIIKKATKALLLIEDNIDYLCYQTYLLANKGLSRDSLEACGLKAINSMKSEGVEKILFFKEVENGQIILWVYVNIRKHKTVFKLIKRKVVVPQVIDPATLSESMFILCCSSPAEALDQIKRDLKIYMRLAKHFIN